MKSSPRQRIVLFLAGGAILVYLLHRAGTGMVRHYLANLGPWIVLPIALVGLQHALRSLSWHAAVRATGHPVPYMHLLRARLGAECLGYLSFTGALGSQTSKVWLLREGVPVRRGAASVVVDALASAIAGVLYGGIALLICQRYLGLPAWTAALGGSLVALATSAWILAAVWSGQRRRHPNNNNVLLPHETPPGWRAAVRDALRQVGAGLVRLKGLPFARMIFIHLFGHLALTAATWSILYLLGISTSLVMGLLFESGAKLGNVMGAFIPARLGVFEAGFAASSGIIRLGPAAGVAVGLVRRLVDLIWVGTGLAILLLGTPQGQPDARAAAGRPTAESGQPSRVRP